jgi:hypothetical protein
LKNLKDYIDNTPFKDSNSKVDFYFAKLINSLQAKIIEADVIKNCHVVKDLVTNAMRFK